MEIENKLKLAKENMPVVEKIRQDFIKSKPFTGLTIGACLHLTKETAVLLMCLQDGGATIAACASNPLSTQNDVADYLENVRGMAIYGKKGMTDEEYQNGLEKVMNAKPDYIIDDGADLTVLIHQVGMSLPKGGLEETTTGVTRIKTMNLKYPILAVNDAKTKHFFDNVYGTGQSTLDGIIRATNTLLAGKTFVVAGYGYCGRGLAQRAKGMGCNVIVTEIDPVKALQAFMDGFRVMPMWDASRIGDIFVTVTGSCNVITRQDMNHMKPTAILANSGHFDIEIDVKAAKELGLNILAEGRLVNLACAEGHPSEVMDMSFANQALGLKYLLDHPLLFKDAKVYNIPVEIDRYVSETKLETLGITIDKETEEQINYRRS